MGKYENSSKLALWAMGLVLTGIVAGCGGGDGGSGGGTANAQPGFLTASLTDAPACGYNEVNVTVSRVRVHRSSSAEPGDAGWNDITLDPPQKINLLDLNDPTHPNGALEQLGQETTLPAGHYTQVRLVLVRNANSVVLSTNPTTEIPLDTPSAVQSGIKLVNEFDVAPDQHVDLLLDFDACKSIVKTGNGRYKLKSVIKVIPYVLNGIEGFINTAFLDKNVVVSAQVGGEIIRATVPNATSTDPDLRGKFFLARLTPGVNYDVVITANSPATTCCATTVITGVPVPTSTSITPISTSSNRFSLQSSGFHTIGDSVTLINPPAPPAVDDRDDATVIVAAKQALSGGPTVTVRTRVATLLDGTPTIGDYEYEVILPTGAPLRAPYNSDLSMILPSSGGEVGGFYTVYGSGTVYDDTQTPIRVYANQSPAPTSVNISGGDRLDQDFTLAP